MSGTTFEQTFVVTSTVPLESSSKATEPRVGVHVLRKSTVRDPRGLAGRATGWTLPILPANTNGDQSLAAADVGGSSVLPTGNRLEILELCPGMSVPMHRNSSVDYVIVTSGTLVLLTPGVESNEVVGENDPSVVRTTVQQGEVIVQRGTLHGWANPSSTEWVRFIAVMNSATAVQGPNGPLENVSYLRPPAS